MRGRKEVAIPIGAVTLVLRSGGDHLVRDDAEAGARGLPSNRDSSSSDQRQATAIGNTAHARKACSELGICPA
jgi:hypothetical protein